jgi:hypothetical protein
MTFFPFQLFQRRECRVLTWRGWLLLAVLATGLAWVAIKTVYPFLAPVEPLPSGALVVEGWVNDGIMRSAVAEIRSHRYQRCFVTGGPIDKGAPLSEHKTLAELGATILLRLGLNTNEVVAVPAPHVMKDRTFVSAMALRDWLDTHNDTETNLTVMTSGPHARRTQLLFMRVMEPRRRVGVIAMRPDNYDPSHWWRSSEGFRTVTGEVIAYVYARLWSWRTVVA